MPHLRDREPKLVEALQAVERAVALTADPGYAEHRIDTLLRSITSCELSTFRIRSYFAYDEVLEQRADLLEELSRWPEVLAAAEGLAIRGGDEREAPFRKLRALEGLGRDDEVIAVASAALARRSRADEPSSDARILRGYHAAALARLGRDREALAELELIVGAGWLTELSGHFGRLAGTPPFEALAARERLEWARQVRAARDRYLDEREDDLDSQLEDVDADPSTVAAAGAVLREAMGALRGGEGPIDAATDRAIVASALARLESLIAGTPGAAGEALASALRWPVSELLSTAGVAADDAIRGSLGRAPWGSTSSLVAGDAQIMIEQAQIHAWLRNDAAAIEDLSYALSLDPELADPAATEPAFAGLVAREDVRALIEEARRGGLGLAR